jgi:peptidoglycan/xylan/chitin deacetylase (PgdA/CDA1 family)
MSSENGRWPTGYSAAVSITLDNMGEAAEIFRGTWPEEVPVGQHSAVRDTLPRILDLFDEFDVRATYFVEGWNTDVYPEVIRSIRNRGHEVGFHGWQHEPWSSLDPESEESSIARNVRAFEDIGVTLRGFRPPGGMLTDSSLRLLRDFGLTYCSPAGAAAALMGDVVILPFDWRGIDAYHYSVPFESLRELKGDSAEPRTPDQLVATMRAVVDSIVASSGYTALLFHPFLEADSNRFQAMQEVISRVRSNSSIWCAPCAEIADWVRDHPDKFQGDPGLDLTTWTRG